MVALVEDTHRAYETLQKLSLRGLVCHWSLLFHTPALKPTDHTHTHQCVQYKHEDWRDTESKQSLTFESSRVHWCTALSRPILHLSNRNLLLIIFTNIFNRLTAQITYTAITLLWNIPPEMCLKLLMLFRWVRKRICDSNSITSCLNAAPPGGFTHSEVVAKVVAF